MATSTEVIRTVVEAETSQFHSRMAAAGQALERFGRAPVSATRSVALMRSSLEQLTTQALGLPGPLGTAVRALSAFGGPQMLAVTAALGAIALAYRAIKADAKETADAVAAADKVFQASLGGSNALRVQIDAAAEALRNVRDRQQEMIDALGRGANIASIEAVRLSEPYLLLEEAANRAEQAVRRLEATQAAAFFERTRGPAIAAQVAGIAAGARGLAIPSPVIPGVPAIAGPAAQLPAGAGIVKTLQEIGQGWIITGDQMAEGLARAESATKGLTGALEQTALSAQQLGVVAIHTFAGLIQGLIASRSGGAGGFFGGLLSAAGGIASIGVKGLFAANPLLGAGLTAAGGIISTISAGRRQEEVAVRDLGTRGAIEQLQRKIEALEARRPKQVTIQIYGSGTSVRDAMARIRREEALGGEPLLPAGV